MSIQILKKKLMNFLLKYNNFENTIFKKKIEKEKLYILIESILNF